MILSVFSLQWEMQGTNNEITEKMSAHSVSAMHSIKQVTRDIGLGSQGRLL